MADFSNQLGMAFDMAKILLPPIVMVVGLKLVAGRIVRAVRPETAPAAVDTFATEIKSRFVRMKWLLDKVSGLDGEERERALAEIGSQMREHTAFLIDQNPRIRQSLSRTMRSVIETYLASVDTLNRAEVDLETLIEGERRAVMEAINALSPLTPAQMRR